MGSGRPGELHPPVEIGQENHSRVQAGRALRHRGVEQSIPRSGHFRAEDGAWQLTRRGFGGCEFLYSFPGATFFSAVDLRSVAMPSASFI